MYDTQPLDVYSLALDFLLSPSKYTLHISERAAVVIHALTYWYRVPQSLCPRGDTIVKKARRKWIRLHGHKLMAMDALVVLPLTPLHMRAAAPE
jgi:hypothetical protein